MTIQRSNILIVDDLSENLRALEGLLRFDGANLLKAQSGEEALELLLKHDCAVALIDIQMPEMDGFELAELMRGMERTQHVPIIFVTAGSRSAEFTFNGYELGAVDFLYKPLDPQIVRSKTQVFLDLDRQKKLLEAQLKESERQADDLRRTEIELQKALEIRNEFLIIASHELKTPITSLTLQLQMLQKRIKLDENLRNSTPRFARGLDTCSIQVKRLTALVEDLLDVSKIKSGKLSFHFEEVDFKQLLEETLDRMSAQLDEAGCTTKTQIENRNIVGKWDRGRIEQVLMNILSNVIKYAPGSPVWIGARTSGTELEITVRDEGPGIPKDKIELIFDRFERATPSRNISGMGLGLFLCKQIVAAHDGTIWVESGPDKGSTFHVRLPVMDSSHRVQPLTLATPNHPSADSENLG